MASSAKPAARALGPSQPPNLNTMLGAVALVLVVCSLALGGALILITTYMHEATHVLNDAVESIRIVEEAQADLIAIRITPPTSTAGGAPRERDLQRNLANAHHYVDSPEEARLLADAERSVAEYLAQQSHGGRGALVVKRLPEFNAALTALARLVDINVSQGREAAARVARLDKHSNVIGNVAIACFLTSVLVLFVGMQRLIRRPLLMTQHAIGRYGAGEHGARAPLLGPRELQDIARTFNQTADELERQREAQRTFLGGVAHDLKTPLTALRMSVGLVGPDRAALPEASVRRTMALVSRQVDGLERMVGDLLDAVRIDAGKLDLRIEERDLRDLVRAVAELYAPIAPPHEIVLALPDPPVLVSCDPVRIEQVMRNLVSNALKYSPDGGEVEVAVSVREGSVETVVRDHGTGIEPDDLARVFEPFRRTDASRRAKVPGVGLGLSVSKRIVEAHGGRIWVESKPGVGSAFHFTIPCALGHPAQAPLTSRVVAS